MHLNNCKVISYNKNQVWYHNIPVSNNDESFCFSLILLIWVKDFKTSFGFNSLHFLLDRKSLTNSWKSFSFLSNFCRFQVSTHDDHFLLHSFRLFRLLQEKHSPQSCVHLQGAGRVQRQVSDRQDSSQSMPRLQAQEVFRIGDEQRW